MTYRRGAFLILLAILSGCDFVFTKQQAFDKGRALVDKGNVKTGIKYLTKASDAGMGEASFVLGFLYWKGTKVDENLNMAKQRLAKGYEQGNLPCFALLQVVRAQEDAEYIATCQYLASDPKLYSGLKQLCEQAEPDIQLEIAKFCFALCEQQESCQPNWKAYAELSMSILANRNKDDQMCVDAAEMMARLMDRGYAYKGDCNSLPFWEKVAAAGDSMACLKVAIAFAEGRVAKKDPQKAIRMFERAKIDSKRTALLYVKCLLGNHAGKSPTRASEIMDSVLENGYGEEKIATLGPELRDLCKELGRIYLKGIGVVPDKKKAFRYLAVSAYLGGGDYWSMVQMAIMYQNGEGVEKDVSRAWSCAVNAVDLARTDEEKRQATELENTLRNELDGIRRKNELRRMMPTPEEVLARTQYVSNKVCAINFSLSKYIAIHPYLVDKVSSARVLEGLWKDLRIMQKKRDWIGFLEAVRKDLTKRTYNQEFEKPIVHIPSLETIDALLDGLAERKFSCIISFQDKSLYDEIRTFSFRSHGCYIRWPHLDCEFISGTNGVVGVKYENFTLSTLPVVITHKNFETESIDKKYKGIEQQIEADVKMGEITDDVAKDRVAENRAKYRNAILTYMRKSKWPIRDSDNSHKGNSEKRQLEERRESPYKRSFRRSGNSNGIRRLGEW